MKLKSHCPKKTLIASSPEPRSPRGLVLRSREATAARATSGQGFVATEPICGPLPWPTQRVRIDLRCVVAPYGSIGIGVTCLARMPTSSARSSAVNGLSEVTLSLITTVEVSILGKTLSGCEAIRGRDFANMLGRLARRLRNVLDHVAPSAHRQAEIARRCHLRGLRQVFNIVR